MEIRFIGGYHTTPPTSHKLEHKRRTTTWNRGRLLVGRRGRQCTIYNNSGIFGDISRCLAYVSGLFEGLSGVNAMTMAAPSQ